MISYVECLGGEGPGPGVASQCWNTGPDEERDELLPRRMAPLQPKTEGSLRRRLLTAKIYQQHHAWLNAGGAAGMPGPPLDDKKTPPWYRPQHLPPRPHIHPYLAPEAHGKLILTPETHGKLFLTQELPGKSHEHSLRPERSAWVRLGQASSCPPTPESLPSYGLPVPSPHSVQPPLKPKAPPHYHDRPRRRRWSRFFSFRLRRRRRRSEATQTTPLLNRGDENTKWSVHFTTQKHQQGLIFVPGKQRSGTAEDLQESHGLTQHVPTSSHCHDPSTASSLSSSGLHQSESRSCSGWKKKTPSTSSDEDETVILSNRPLTPLVLNPLHLTSSLNVSAPFYQPTVNVEIEPSSRLPTPEEKMRQLSGAVGADIVPINITGESFDRQASFRKRLSSADLSSRRPHNFGRQTTLTGKPDVKQKLDLPLILPGQLSVVDGPVSSCTSNQQQETRDKKLEKSCSLHVDPSSYCCTVQSLSSLATNSHLVSESSCTTTPYRTSSASSSCSQAQVLQGFLSDLMPLVPFGPKAKVISESSCESEWSYPSDKPPNVAAQCHSSTSSSQYLSSSSIADSESQFSYQALHDQIQHSNQLSCDGSSFSDDSWSYQPLSPSSSHHSSQTGGDWSSINQETKCVSGEGWNCDPLLSSGRSSPAFSECNSLCSENIPSSFLLNQKTKKFSTSSYSHTIIRSISLRKSKHPPLPPLRCDSLRRPPGRTKPSHSSSSPRLNNSLCLELAMQQTLNSAQTFDDPWVPRETNKTLQTQLNCRTVTTFEPLYPDCDVATSAASPISEHLPQSASNANVIPPGSPGSEEETRKFILNSHSVKSSVVGLHRLVSPSSGYSSQSNTPLSSPLAPSSPLTPSSGACPLTSPFSSLHSSSNPLSSPISNLSKMRAQGDGRPKPPVPERKSSLFSYSTSSLSSCTSSEHPVPPPPPPPLPSSPASSVLYSPTFEFAPVSHLCLPAESSVSKLSGTPTSLSSPLPPQSPPHPPPPPPLPNSSLPTPPPLPSSFHPSPPPYSYTIRHALKPPLSQSPVFCSTPFSEIPPLPLTDLLPPPPPYLPSLPSPSLSSVVPSPSLSKSFNPCVSVPTCPLVTAQALQGVKLRSMKNQKGLPTSIMLANGTLAADCPLRSQAFPLHADTCHYLPRKEDQPNCSVFGNTNDEDLAHPEDKPARVGLQNVFCNLGRNETLMSSGLSGDSNHATWYTPRSDQEYYNLTKCEGRKSCAESVCICPQSLPIIVSSPVTQRKSDCQIIQSREQHTSHPDSTWIELLMGNDQHQIDTVIQETNSHEQQISDNTLTNAKLTKPIDKYGNTENDSLYWNEVPQKHGRVTLLESEDKVNSNDKNRLEMQTQTAADRPVAYSDTAQSDRVFKSEANMLQKQKPDLRLTSPTNKEPLFPSKNAKEVHSGTSGTCGTLEITRMSHNQNATATSTTGIVRTSDSKNTGIISTLKNWHSAEGFCTMERSNVSSMDYKTLMCLPSGNMNWTTIGVTSSLENYGNSETLQTLEEHGITSAQTDGTQYGPTELCTVYKDKLAFYNRIVKSSFAKYEEDGDEEDEKVEERTTKMSSTKFQKSDKARKRRRRRTCRQLMMMQSTTKPSPSSSSSSSSASSSSSSGDELDVDKEKTILTSERMRMTNKVCDEETSTSDSCCAQSRCSLSSELSSESLCGEFPFPDLLIQETGEKEENQISNKEAQRTAKEPRGLPGDLFISVSADQMFMSSQSRSTEDLFAVIHRSKRKMLERRSSEETRRYTKSPSAEPGPSSTRLVAFKTSKSSSTESFKALLLRKGSRPNPGTGTSAVERLCKVISPTNNLQSVLNQTPFKPTSSFHTLTGHDDAARLTPDVSAFSQQVSTIHLFFPSSMRLRSLTPPCSSRSRFAAHYRPVAAPMTAISEGVCEEDNE
ncbi:serine-rich adhesin for platelets isoform X2 [Betta splendens]|uniref:Serine-rich adhesin for platelets isoform X2 n=1 Tax=Betta splendens TaxID=158456 RepID=A0A9W2XFJ0_BETSP|nr:serine-rich adhesin for platelets isoform X2 [Betta splendens]